MNFHVDRRLLLVAAVLGAVALFATGFFVALGVWSVVAGPGAAPVAQAPVVSHTHDQIELPVGTWPGLDADMVDGKQATQLLPSGVIVMWSGDLASIPEGWALCDGAQGTPDLRDRFIYYVSTGEDPGAIGGSTSHSHSYSDLPQHNHGITDPGHTHSDYYGGTGGNMYVYDGTANRGFYDHRSSVSTTGITVNDAGQASSSTEQASSLPPYYKLAFIMKL